MNLSQNGQKRGIFDEKEWKFALKMQIYGQNWKYDKFSGILVLDQFEGAEFNAAICFSGKTVFAPIWRWFLIFHAKNDLNGIRYVP